MTSSLKNKGNHIHKLELTSTQWQSPSGYSGTAALEEYAYLLCQCGEVRKVKAPYEY